MHHQSLLALFIFLCLLISTSCGQSSDQPPDKAEDDKAVEASSTSYSTSILSSSTSKADGKDDSKNNKDDQCPEVNTGEHRNLYHQYEDYPSYDSADRPYFGRVRLPDDTLYLAGLQIEPIKTMYNLICVEVAMVAVFGLVLALSNFINARRQKCYYAKIHAAWGVVHGAGSKSEAASIAGAAASKKQSSLASPRY